MQTFIVDGVNPYCDFLEQVEPIPSAVPSFQKFFQVSAAAFAISTLSLHDALPIYALARYSHQSRGADEYVALKFQPSRSEEHTSELQSRVDLVCRLLLEKKKGGCQY